MYVKGLKDNAGTMPYSFNENVLLSAPQFLLGGGPCPSNRPYSNEKVWVKPTPLRRVAV